MMTEAVTESFEVRVPAFEGPLDLLLHLIHENQINIYDIPIAQITRQYLEALEWMKSLNLAIAAEFLVMAATLILIKSKMLLPVHETSEEEAEEAGEDPRHELMIRLLEYKKFKEAAGKLASRESVWRQIFCRPPSNISMITEIEDMDLGDITTFDLLDALTKVMARLPEKDGWVVEPEELSVRDQMHTILSRMEVSQTLLFDQLFEGVCTRAAVVVTFLALLEMVRLRLIGIMQVEMCGPLRLLRVPESLQTEETHGRS